MSKNHPAAKDLTPRSGFTAGCVDHYMQVLRWINVSVAAIAADA
jgi:hypothetical protein